MSFRNEDDRASNWDSGSLRVSPKAPPSDVYRSSDSLKNRRSSPSPSDRSFLADQSRSYSARGLVEESEASGRHHRGGQRRRGDYSDDNREARRSSRGSYESHSDDQYSSEYESEVSDSGSASASRSYDSRRSPSGASTSVQSDKRGPAKGYDGDVSGWGRTKVNLHGRDNSESEYTLSSGLSPRGSEAEQRAEFDPEEAKRALAYNAGMYGRAQTMRREGTAPKTMGIADDLPNRFALEQLSTLAGMASKVQAAIEHNRRVFANRVRMEDRAGMKKAFDAWRAVRFGNIAKQQLLRRAIARLQRGLLSRAFLSWKDKFHLVDKYLAMRRKVTATINRGRLKRTFAEWRRLCEERWWKNQLAAREAQIHAQNLKVEGFEKRPIVVLRRRRLSAIMEAWFNASDERRRRRLRKAKAMKYWKNMAYLKAWNAWRWLYLESVRRREIVEESARKIWNRDKLAAWNKWWEAVEERRLEGKKLLKAVSHWIRAQASRAMNQWRWYTKYMQEYKIIINRWKNPLKARALRGWAAGVEWRKRKRLVLKRAAMRMFKKTLWTAWEAWFEFMDKKQWEERHLPKEETEAKIKRLEDENARLLRDNERFVRLIDSGEWGRGRVAELVSAGEILKGERDALVKLIQSLRHEYEAVQAAKAAQDEEMRGIKDRMMLGGAARNKMLVKGGSSFNALVRAMKQDLVEGGPGAAAANRDPNLLYQVDKLSLDQVTVFPDGELNVQAVAAAPGAAAFARPVSAGRGLRHAPSNALGPGPVQPMRMPTGFAGSPSPGRMGAPTPAGRPGPPLALGASPGSGRPMNREEVVARLQGMSKEQLDNFEAALRAQRAAGGAGRVQGPGAERPAGMASTSPAYR